MLTAAMSYLACLWLIITRLWHVNGLCSRPAQLFTGLSVGAEPLCNSGVTLGTQAKANTKEERVQGRDTEETEEERQPLPLPAITLSQCQRTSLFCFTEHLQLCMAVNCKWATNVTVRETECCKHDETRPVLPDVPGQSDWRAASFLLGEK